MIEALLILLGCGLGGAVTYWIGRTEGHGDGYAEGFRDGAADISEVADNAFRAGFRARELAGETAVIEGAHLAAQRQAGRERRQ